MALDAIQEPMSLNEPINRDNGDALYVMDQIRDESGGEEEWARSLALRNAMDRLSERERKIVRMRFSAAARRWRSQRKSASHRRRFPGWKRLRCNTCAKYVLSQATENRMNLGAAGIEMLCGRCFLSEKGESTMTYTQLKQKEVVNTCDGAKLGNVCDLDLSPDGRILALIVPGVFRSPACSRAGRNHSLGCGGDDGRGCDTGQPPAQAGRRGRKEG